ncbi:MAG: FAD-binding protein, partial [Candidatus Omnitrophica bacterium]|nr:FAD-binding protein [Candidatus Omnitrophota bacterium]
MGLKIFSLMKQVPIPSQMRMGDDGLMDRTKAKSIINVDCSFAIEQALEIKDQVKDAELAIVSMGPPSFEQSLKKAISMGFDKAYLLSDRRLGGSDTYATGYSIAYLLRKLGYDHNIKEPFIIFAGRQTSDGDTAHVPSQVAENLGIPQATFVEKVDFKGDHVIVRRIIEGGHQVIKLPIPCLLSITPTATVARRPSLLGAMKARKAEIGIWNIDQIGVRADQVGLNGSPTIVAKVVDIERERPPVVMISGTQPADFANGLAQEVEKVSKEDPHSGKVDATAEKKVEAEKVQKKPDFPLVDFRDGARGIMTWVEMHGKTPTRSSLEILNPARELADQLETKVTAVMIGHQVKEAAQDIIAHGADEVVVVEDPRLAEYATLPVASVFAQIIEKNRPEIALFGATTSGRELAPRLASRVRAGVTADCTSLKVGEFVHRIRKSIMYPCLEAIRPTYGESKLATIVGFWCPQMATARPGTFNMLAKDPSRKGNVVEFQPELKPEDFLAEIVETVRQEGGATNLFAADIIISGGRPCGEIDDFALVRELAKALQEKGINADWGASRRAVDGGFVEYGRQIGQT